MMARKRLGSRHGPPKTIGIISLSPNADLQKLTLNMMLHSKLLNDIPNSFNYAQTISTMIEKRESRFTLVLAPRDPIAVVDVAKTADILLLVMAPREEDGEDLGVDILGNHFLQLIKAQGVPGVIGVAQGVSTVTPPKKQQALSKLCQRFYSTVFETDTKVFHADNSLDIMSMFRWMAHASPRDITWRQGRCRMLGQSVTYVPNDTNAVTEVARRSGMGELYKPNLGSLRITGYLRGESSISANQLVHLTGFGDFQVICIEGESEDASHLHSKEKAIHLLSRIGEKRESMQDLLPVDSSANEQSLITEEELAQAVAANPHIATTSALFSTGADGTISINNPNVPSGEGAATETKSWTRQDLHKIQSYSTLNSGTLVDTHALPVISKSRLDDDLVLNKDVWDDIDVSDDDEDDYESEDEMDDGMELGVGFGANNTNPTSNRFLNNVDDDDEDEVDVFGDMDDTMGGMTLAEALQQKRELRNARSDKKRDEDTMSTYSMYSIASLRGRSLPGSDGAIPLRFQDLSYKEKAQRLLKMGERGEDKLVKEKKKLEADDTTWNDEPEIDPTITMRARFVRYRGLKSFKHSSWDTNEGLPSEYAQIFQFANFHISQRNAKEDCEIMDGPEDLAPETAEGRAVRPERCAPVTITIANVTAEMAEKFTKGIQVALLWGLFRHEHKVSVLHMSLKRHPEYELPIKSKDPMHFQVGFRRFTAAPVYSKAINGTEKTLMQRWFRNDGFTVVSVYGRVTFPPSNVLMFPASVLGSYKAEFPFNPLAASGKLLTCDPNKIILKRSVMTGYPVETHGFRAVIKHMFFNADDVRWFRPCEIWTKKGLSGRIDTSRGTHGLFKATFDHKIQSNDTVCLALYKRQFPPWNPAYIG